MKATSVNRGSFDGLFIHADDPEAVFPPHIFKCDTVRSSLAIVLARWLNLSLTRKFQSRTFWSKSRAEWLHQYTVARF
jgi:hypothetical protein